MPTDDPAPVTPRPAHTVDRAADAVDAMRALNLSLHRFRHQIAMDVGVNVVDTIAMSALAAQGPMAIGELASRVSLVPSGMTTLVDRLERRGLLRREPRPDNRRAIDVHLTEKGTQTLDSAFEFARERFAELDVDGDLETFVRVANSIADALEALAIDLGHGDASVLPK